MKKVVFAVLGVAAALAAGFGAMELASDVHVFSQFASDVHVFSPLASDVHVYIPQ